jgi:hypothetical protein
MYQYFDQHEIALSFNVIVNLRFAFPKMWIHVKLEYLI